MAIALFATFIVTSITAFYCYRRFWAHRFFKRLGIPGPEPHWFWGNLRELYAKPRQEVVQEWTKIYGQHYGYFEGSTPYLITSSTDAVEQFCVKQFSNFQGRHVLPIEPDGQKDLHRRIFNVSVGSAFGDHWKRLRTAMNPAFTTGKLKSYMSSMEKHNEQLLTRLKKRCENRSEFDIQPEFQCYTLDVISEITFGVDLATYGEDGNRKEHDILPIMRVFFASITQTPGWMYYLMAIPEFRGPLVLFLKWACDHVGSFGPFRALEMSMDLTKGVIEARRSNPSLARPDILQSMMESTGLTDVEIQMEGFAFLAAGTETTSSLLTYVAYRLAHHPEIQQKLYQENEKLLFGPDKKILDYESIMSAPYLDAVFQETLRIDLQSPSVLNRWALEETTICGMNIPKGLNVVANQVAIHFDPELWGPVPPQQYYPDRFLKEYVEQHPRPESAFLGFGLGPKMCIGLRLAQIEFKLALAHLIHNFKLVERVGGYPNGLPVTGDLGVLPAEGAIVRLEARK